MTVTNPEPLRPGEDTAFEPAIEPYCTVDGLKRHAKLLRSVLDPDKTIKLSRTQFAVLRCIGHSVQDVFSGRKPPIPVFPAHVTGSDRRDYQRLREIATLTELFPNHELATIVEFVSSWNLVHWREVALDHATHTERLRHRQNSLLADPPRHASAGITASRVLPENIAVEEARLLSTATLTPTERFMPPSIDFASEKAIALARIASTNSRGLAYCITARIFGFHSWADFEASFQLASRSKFDEELSASASAGRRKCQAQLLESLLPVDRFSAIDLLSLWKPTSSSMIYMSDLSWNPAVESNTPVVETRRSIRLGGTLSAKPRTKPGRQS
ncbi:hypothetical protein [Paraburkholderia caribensis]|uniref:hypothetical protein n=1 Tax=Paraburkholderia caribensis TaxID=75105 RepID=UPI000A5289DC|nr:hypothetical protein [Paraburkholderia caribensis]